ncbi:unnamed protein product [Polarella glacialis]|uniref:Non-canonical purine NTP pyrophosphatase n=1 Tax=Polarella glacialis TaxID=89957 RepID=A0A813HAJ7_POLGL|nr:unnamed protein product [Polarella glacialis]CAE8709540.1 unnamed protein product [Polarella glacialis]
MIDPQSHSQDPPASTRGQAGGSSGSGRGALGESDASPKRRRVDVPTVRALYVTGNDGKYQEAMKVVELLQGGGTHVHLERVNVDLPELQGRPEEVAVAKTQEAARQLESQGHDAARFVITDDSGLELSCLNGFPGIYIKPMLQSLGDAGIAELVHHYEDQRATATCMLGVLDREHPPGVSVFRGELRGTIVKEPLGSVKHGKLSWNTIFVPLGEERTFGQMPLEEHALMSHRRHAFASWLTETFPS